MVPDLERHVDRDEIDDAVEKLDLIETTDPVIVNLRDKLKAAYGY
jgi:hypothetical protein